MPLEAHELQDLKVPACCTQAANQACWTPSCGLPSSFWLQHRSFRCSCLKSPILACQAANSHTGIFDYCNRR